VWKETNTDAAQPANRWMLTSPDGGQLGEMRDTAVRWALTDQDDTTVSTLDDTGAIVASFTYDSYGKATGATSAEEIATPLRFTGMRYDPISGTTHHGARDYNASLRTWTQTDQYLDPFQDLGLSTDPMTQARTFYAGGNPINNIDEDGHGILGFISNVVHAVVHVVQAAIHYVMAAVHLVVGNIVSVASGKGFLSCRQIPSCRSEYRAAKAAKRKAYLRKKAAWKALKVRRRRSRAQQHARRAAHAKKMSGAAVALSAAEGDVAVAAEAGACVATAPVCAAVGIGVVIGWGIDRAGYNPFDGNQDAQNGANGPDGNPEMGPISDAELGATSLRPPGPPQWGDVGGPPYTLGGNQHRGIQTEYDDDE
jgi:RHS repeat-associated protein